MSNEKAKQQQQGTEWVEFKETSLDDIPPKLDQRRGNAEKVSKIGEVVSMIDLFVANHRFWRNSM